MSAVVGEYLQGPLRYATEGPATVILRPGMAMELQNVLIGRA